MARAGKGDPAGRRAVLLEARARIDRELAALDAGCPPGSPELAQDGHGPEPGDAVRLKAAADAWGVSYAAAQKRAVRLARVGLAEKRRPGGWRVSLAGLGHAFGR